MSKSKLEPTEYPGGRIGWPDVVTYRWRVGNAVVNSPLPLMERNTPYHTVAHDVEALEDLRRTNRLYDPRHTGSGQAIHDGRKAPGA